MGLSSLSWGMVTVVCTGGEAPPPSLCLDWLDRADSTVAADSGLALLRAMGRKADLWVGDGDSLVGPLSQWSDWYLRAEVLDRAKDDTDTEAAVKRALADGADEVWLVGGSGRRMDHWWANLRLVGFQSAITRWLTAHEQIGAVKPGERYSVPTGTVSVFPVGDGPWSVSSQGLRWPLDGVDFRRWHSLSNEALPGSTLTVREGRFLVLTPLAGGPL